MVARRPLYVKLYVQYSTLPVLFFRLVFCSSPFLLSIVISHFLAYSDAFSFSFVFNFSPYLGNSLPFFISSFSCFLLTSPLLTFLNSSSCALQELLSSSLLRSLTLLFLLWFSLSHSLLNILRALAPLFLPRFIIAFPMPRRLLFLFRLLFSHFSLTAHFFL